MCVRAIFPDPARAWAALHTGPGEFPEPLEQWDGFGNAFCSYLGQTGGINNLVAKPTYHAIDWMRQCGPVSETTQNIHQAALTFKNFQSLTALPQGIRDLYNSLSELCCCCSSEDESEESYASRVEEVAYDFIYLVNPAVEVVEGLQASRVIQLPSQTMTTLGHCNAASLLIYNALEASNALCVIGKAIDAINQEEPLAKQEQTQENLEIRQEIAPTVIALQLIVLARRISYVVMAALTLIAAFFVGAIANPAVWILAASTSALVFTIIDEFASRAFNPYHPQEIRLPKIGNEEAPEDWDWASKSVAGSDGESEASGDEKPDVAQT